MNQSEIGTDAGTIPNLYLWDGFNTGAESRLGSADVTQQNWEVKASIRASDLAVTTGITWDCPRAD